MTERCEDLSLVTMERKGTKCPWSYFLIRSASLSSFAVALLTISFRLLFEFALKIFCGSIVVLSRECGLHFVSY